MLNDLLIERLSALDEVLLQAIEEVFNEQIAKEFSFIQPGDSNTLIGEKYRALATGKRIIEQSLIEIKSYTGGRIKTKNFRKEL